jgi:hypothetical protein
MSTLDSLIAVSGEAPPADVLDYGLPRSTTSIVDRQVSTRAYPSSASSLSPTGLKTARIRLGGDGFADPSTARLQFTIQNLAAADTRLDLYPKCGPHGAWGQVVLRSGGVEITNFLHYGRWHEQYVFRQATVAEQYGEAGVTGLCGAWVGASNNRPSYGKILGGSSYTVLHKIPFALFAPGQKMINLKYCPLELELTLANPEDWLDAPAVAVAGGARGKTRNFQLNNVQLLVDCVTLDEAVQDSFFQNLINGRSLITPILNYHQVVTAVPNAASCSISIVRALSRICAVWVTFRTAGGDGRSYLFNPPLNAGAIGAPGFGGDFIGATPTLDDSAANNGTPLTCRLSLGPKNWPHSQPIGSQSGLAEFYYMMTKTLGFQPNIDRDEFGTDSFTIAFSLLKYPHDPASATSSRSGDQLWLNLTGMTPGAVAEAWVTIASYGAVVVQEASVTVLM